MRRVGLNSCIRYTLLRWGWKSLRKETRCLAEYASPMPKGGVSIRQERLSEGLDRVFGIADAEARAECRRKIRRVERSRTLPTTRGRPGCWQHMFATEMEAFGYNFEGPVGKKTVVSFNNE